MRRAAAEREKLAKQRELRCTEIARPLKIASEPFSFGDGRGSRNFRSSASETKPLPTVAVEVATSEGVIGKMMLRRHDDVAKVVRRFAVGNSLTSEQEKRLLKHVHNHVSKEETWKLHFNSPKKTQVPPGVPPLFPPAVSPPPFDFALMPKN